jgi:hypothetical protein
MFGRKRSDRRNDSIMPYGLTPGQTFDIADTGMDVSRGLSGQGGLSWGVGAFAALDVAISAGSSRPGQMLGNVAGAVAAQTAGLATWYVGGAVGSAVGGTVGAIVGGVVGGPVGAGAGEIAGAWLGKWGTRIAGPILIDPYVRRISKPINRMVGLAQHRVAFGGFQDSQQAYTMRQRALQEMRGSLLNATQYIGREGQMMHQ